MAAKTEEIKEETKTEVDMEELVTVKIHKSRDQQADVFVSLNGRNLQIQRGIPVEVPRWAFEILENSERMDEVALERQSNSTKQFA